HAAARVTLRDPVDREPLRRRQDTARQADADHEDVVGLELLLRALVADIAVVLLVYPVKLQELPIFLGDRAGHGIGERALDGAAQETARALDVLDRGQWLVSRHPSDTASPPSSLAGIPRPHRRSCPRRRARRRRAPHA